MQVIPEVVDPSRPTTSFTIVIADDHPRSFGTR